MDEGVDRARVAGLASAAAAQLPSEYDPSRAAAFFDVDNTIMRGASLFHLAVGMARRKFFSTQELIGFGMAQARFIVRGTENADDMAEATEAALAFVKGRQVEEIIAFGQAIFDDTMIDKMIPGTLALAQEHLEAGRQVWLVTATPIELAQVIARRLGLTGALGTVSEVSNGAYTGCLVGAPLHGKAKAEAVRALAQREGLDLGNCWAYSDSTNDLPMLGCVGNPVAVNPDPKLRAHAREHSWPIQDFRARRHVHRAVGSTAAVAAGGLATGLLVGFVAGRTGRFGR
ncbi:MAG TPA: HAD-IB family hydrolase [Actinobacteria bacterium]|nr:HAD-IB family hydrolase [Actinomycetota bacterium]